jgi:hypothetical protein
MAARPTRFGGWTTAITLIFLGDEAGILAADPPETAGDAT